MQLYYSATSPFARKVLMVLHLTGLMENCELLLTNPLENSSLRQINPLGKVPALIDGDLNLIDSPLICEYLDERAQSNLLRKGTPEYFHIRLVCAYGDGLLDAAVATVMESRRSDAEQSHFWKQRWHQSILQSLARLPPAQLGAPDTIHMATVTALAALGYLDFRLPNMNWRDTRPDLADWYEPFAALPWVFQTTPK